VARRAGLIAVLRQRLGRPLRHGLAASERGSPFGELGAREAGDPRDEPIAPPADGDDVLVVTIALVERLPNHRDVPGEIVRLDERVGPDVVKELLLVDELPVGADEQHENLERLRCQRNFVVAAVQPASHRVGDERTELEQGIRRPGGQEHGGERPGDDARRKRVGAAPFYLTSPACHPMAFGRAHVPPQPRPPINPNRRFHILPANFTSADNDFRGVSTLLLPPLWRERSGPAARQQGRRSGRLQA
jgi:hypothetical protein